MQLNNKTNINWFPGHMAKALRKIKEQLKAVDVVIELLDARAPFSSHNPKVQALIGKKPHLIILTKTDLADARLSEEWLEYYRLQGKAVMFFNLKSFDSKLLKQNCQQLLKEKFLKEKAKGLRERPIRALIVGIPNVGKSSLINKLAGRKAANVENRPGVTRNQQFVKVDQDFVLLDTPGVLWPNLEDKRAALNLALIGTIKDTVLPKDFLGQKLIEKLIKDYPGSLKEAYKLDEDLTDEKGSFTILEAIAKSRSFLKEGSALDTERALNTLLKEFADGKLGRFSLERVSDLNG